MVLPSSVRTRRTEQSLRSYGSGSGLDVVVEGSAARVTNKAKLQRLAALWKSKLDWRFEVGDEALPTVLGAWGWYLESNQRKCSHSARRAVQPCPLCFDALDVTE